MPIMHGLQAAPYIVQKLPNGGHNFTHDVRGSNGSVRAESWNLRRSARFDPRGDQGAPGKLVPCPRQTTWAGTSPRILPGHFDRMCQSNPQ